MQPSAPTNREDIAWESEEMIHNEILSHACLNGYYQKDKKITSVAEDIEKREPSHIVGGTAIWFSYYLKQYRGSWNN